VTKPTFYVVICCYWIAVLSIVYFIALLIGLPIWATLIIGALTAIVFVRYSKSDRSVEPHASGKSRYLVATILLAGGCLVIAYKSHIAAEKYGHWDAWWFWNMRANYLSNPEHWKLAFSGARFNTMFTVPVAHSDYPPFLPLIIGFCWRLLNAQPSVVPFALGMAAQLLTASVLFNELYQRSKLIGAAALVFFISQGYVMALGIAQTADVWVGLFLLLAFVCYHHFQFERDNRLAVLTGAMLGCCMWAKNEGILITLVFLLFNLPVLLRRRALSRLLLGGAIPTFSLLAFKLFIAPPNDIVGGHILWRNFSEGFRYREISETTWLIIKEYYIALPYLMAGYLGLCIWDKRRIDRAMAIILVSFLGFCVMYLLSPHNIGWHVRTSVDRLIFQLLPAIIWVIGVRVSKGDRLNEACPLPI
jgi:hypothetical protein